MVKVVVARQVPTIDIKRAWLAEGVEAACH
jgi:hypothetical protein